MRPVSRVQEEVVSASGSHRSPRPRSRSSCCAGPSRTGISTGSHGWWPPITGSSAHRATRKGPRAPRPRRGSTPTRSSTTPFLTAAATVVSSAWRQASGMRRSSIGAGRRLDRAHLPTRTPSRSIEPFVMRPSLETPARPNGFCVSSSRSAACSRSVLLSTRAGCQRASRLLGAVRPSDAPRGDVRRGLRALRFAWPSRRGARDQLSAGPTDATTVSKRSRNTSRSSTSGVLKVSSINPWPSSGSGSGSSQ